MERTEILASIQNYLSNGGLFNPELIGNNKIRDLLIDVRNHLKYPKPNYAADILVFAGPPRGYKDILLIKRKQDPFAGKWAFPGGHVNEGETSKTAALRELLEETNVPLKFKLGALVDTVVLPDNTEAPVYPLGVFDKPGRDPRGWYVSHSFCVFLTESQQKTLAIKGGDDAEEAAWHPVRNYLGFHAQTLAFDHNDILYYAAMFKNYRVFDEAIR